MKHIIYLVFMLSFFAGCQSEFNNQEARSFCEEGEMDNFISVKVTNNETGEEFTQQYLDNIFVTCVSGEEYRTFQDSIMKSRIYYSSGLVYDRSNRTITDIQISFDHQDSCDAAFSNMNAEYVSLKINLGEDVFYMSILNPEIGFGLGSGNTGAITASELISYGQEVGDVISGSIFAESVGTRKVDNLGNVLNSVDDGVIRYAVELCYRHVVQ